MPIEMALHGRDTDPLVFPLTLNDLPFDMSSVIAVALIYSGYDGKLAETVVSGATVTIYAATSGYVKWAQTSGQIDPRYSPYRIWFRCSISGGGDLSVPREDYFLVRSIPTTY